MRVVFSKEHNAANEISNKIVKRIRGLSCPRSTWLAHGEKPYNE